MINKWSHSWDRCSFSNSELCGHIHMVNGLVQSLSCPHSAQRGSISMITIILKPEFSDLCWWPGQNTLETPGPIASILTVRLGQEQCQQQCNLWVCTMGQRWPNRAHPQTSSSREGILGVFSPMGVLQVHLPHTPQIRNTAQKQTYTPLLQQLGSRPHPWHSIDNHRAKGSPH